MKIRIYGHIGKLTGYGRACADLCMALLATGKIDLEICPMGKVGPAEASVALDKYAPLRAHLRHEHELAKPDVIIVHTLPLDCQRVMAHVMTNDPGLDPDTPWIAYTTYEAMPGSVMPCQHRSTGPAVGDVFEDFDKLWVPSHATAKRFGGPSDWCSVIPHAFDPDTLGWRRNFHRPHGPFRFYYVGAWTSRKNPMGLLRAWAHAFTPDDAVELWLHSRGASQEAFAVAMSQTGLVVEAMAKVRLITTDETEHLMRAQDGAADCFVTATRGEAWNLPAFDAMLAGRHVIHPRGMGADDYLIDTSADLYGGFLMPAAVDVMVTERMANGVKMTMIGAQGLSSQDVWLEPDLVGLAGVMRDVFTSQRRDLVVSYDVAERFGYPAVGKAALSLLEDL